MHGQREETLRLTPAATTGSVWAKDLSATRLYFQRCTWCGTAAYHRLLCPACRNTELRIELSEGTGTVRYSRTLLRRGPSARNESLIELTEGFVVRARVMGLSVGIPVGARVQLVTPKDVIRKMPLFRLLEA
ncbi:putative OB-fold protein [Streptomyces sp. SAI-135]|jgi:hypothetical protein|uniref:Zn-ribbon domain-containing OB-fold protein n=1 Tax=Streptomyces sp. SAI-124 TaxID=3377730 RepID=UPI00247D6463|nr:putative OB-fold protein [Streptomyces sp. SAI-090]MDH6573656.1 putative OB-fold protein [Streptomyces sp. SAI-117]MDH6581611.1 putative OB-fold protein [Streptomyces sp. SAI-133]MDH6613616.1 putative OB-fold protein [Streptomyces sp. SAI-135]